MTMQKKDKDWLYMSQQLKQQEKLFHKQQWKDQQRKEETRNIKFMFSSDK